MTHDFSIVALMLNASWVVQAVVLLLISVSIISWAAIFRKIMALRRVNQDDETFEREFWSGASLNDLYSAANQRGRDSGPMERIFAGGMREFAKLRERRISDPSALLDGARRAMRAGLQRELDALEVNLSFLGSVGSVSPYVGLFGTVWGIMHAFTGLASMAQVTLATVAPGIAEALVATVVRPGGAYSEVSSSGFRQLAGYIFGGNEGGRKIAMTAPVHMELGSDSSRMSFVMPEDLAMDSLPRPNDPDVRLHRAPEEVVAALRFSGFANEQMIQERSAELLERLVQQGLTPLGPVRYLGYNPPWQLVGRRNEVVVSVKWPA